MARKTRALSEEQKSMLIAVRRIARQRTKINATYVAAVVEARKSGATYASIADAVGTSSQAVQEIVRRHHKQEQHEPNQHQTAAGAPAGAIAAVADVEGGQTSGDAGGAGSGGPGASRAFPSPAL